MIWAQFSDETKTLIIRTFYEQQDTTLFPNQEELPEDDPRYVEFLRTHPIPRME